MFRSLAARLFAILTLGLILIQIVSFGAFLAFRGHETKEKMFEYLGADVAFIYAHLAALPPEARLASMTRANRGYFTFSLEAGTVSPEAAQAFVHKGLLPVAQTLRAHLRGDLVIGARYPITKIPKDKVQYAPPPYVGYADTQAHAVELLFQLPQDQVLVMHLVDPFGLPGIGTLAGYLFIILLAITPFVWIAVRLTTRRIGQMLDTLERFGRNLGSPPLPENGPDELVRAAIAFNRMRERILKHLDERTQILASISHDLQTPLTRLRLRAENLEDEGQRERFIADVEHMNGLVREGLDYARSAHLQEEHIPIEVNQWLEGLVDACSDTGAHCQLTGKAGAPYKGAPRALTRAMQNLIDNAIKYSGDVCVEIADSPAELMLRVLDRGPGLSDEMLDKAFEPFMRGEASRNRATGGTGLGLSIARNLVRAHGGELTLANRSGGGLAATVVLPRETARCNPA